MKDPAGATAILGSLDQLAREVTRRHLDRRVDLVARYGTTAEARCTEDAMHHLRHLAAAVATGRQDLYDGYLAWVTSLFHTLGLARDELTSQLDVLADTLGEALDGVDTTATVVRSALDRLPERPSEVESHLDPTTAQGRLAQTYLRTLLEQGRGPAVALLVDAAADTGIEQLYLDVLQPCLREVGRLWQLGRISVAQEHLVTAATQIAMARLSVQVLTTPRVGRKVVVASIGGELHEIGARMLADVFELHGWDAHFVGANTPTRGLVELVRAEKVDVVALSTTVAANLPGMIDTVAAVRAAVEVPVIVGGRPFLAHADLWRDAGADGTAADALGAVRLATDLTSH